MTNINNRYLEKYLDNVVDRVELLTYNFEASFEYSIQPMLLYCHAEVDHLFSLTKETRLSLYTTLRSHQNLCWVETFRYKFYQIYQFQAIVKRINNYQMTNCIIT